MTKPQIIREVTEGDKLIVYEAKLTATAWGNSAHIPIPKKLIGKRFHVKLLEDSK